MAQVLVPGVAQAVVGGTVGPHPFRVVWHYKLVATGQPWSNLQLQNLATSIQSGLGLFIAPLSGQQVNFLETITTDIGQASPSTPGVAATTHTGTETGQEPPPSTCVLVQNLIADRYKGGHPRSYMPPGSMTAMNTTEDSWQASYVNNYSTAMTNLQDQVFSQVPGIQQCAVRYLYSIVDDPIHHKYVHTRTGVKGTPTVVNWIAKTQLATQRRRLVS